MFPPNAPPQIPAGGTPPMPPVAGGAPPMPSPGAGVPDQMLLQRFRALTPQEHAALEAISPEGAQAIMKLIPELKSVIQMVLDEEGGSEGTEGDENVTTGPEAEAEMTGMEHDAGGPMPPQRSRTALGRI